MFPRNSFFLAIFSLLVLSSTAFPQKLQTYYESFDLAFNQNEAIEADFRVNSNLFPLLVNKSGKIFLKKNGDFIITSKDYYFKYAYHKIVESKKIKGKQHYTIYKNLEELAAYRLLESLRFVDKGLVHLLSSFKKDFVVDINNGGFDLRAKNRDYILQELQYSNLKYSNDVILKIKAKRLFSTVTVDLKFFNIKPLSRIPTLVMSIPFEKDVYISTK